MFEPTWESVRTHVLPTWYDDAKLGIFLHWGLYSVPGWAPQVPDIQELLRTRGPKGLLRTNPYAEWYLNSMQLVGSPTWVHHRANHGDAPYEQFVEPFNDASAGADLDALAGLCQEVGARYVVLTAKHHDGFTLWPSSVDHPRKGAYHARRDLVGGLTGAVRARGLRMGLYYSGGYDWPYNDAVLSNPADAMLAVPAGPDYLAYATTHVRELIDRYQPSLLWNDICWPAGGNLAGLFAHYYNAVPDGVINDRWLEARLPRHLVTDTMARGVGELAQVLWRFIPDDRKSLTFPGAMHYDITTPEYAHFGTIMADKWEATRGVGHSFGANRNERREDIVTTTELVRSFCDIVAKNGNLLIGIGPTPAGVIPDEQVVPLRGLGAWLAVNGEAIFGSRPWEVAETTTSEGTGVRFTERDGLLYALLIDTPGRSTFSLRHLDTSAVTDVRLLGVDEPLEWSRVEGELTVTLPGRLPVAAAHVLCLGHGVRPRRLPDVVRRRRPLLVGASR